MHQTSHEPRFRIWVRKPTICDDAMAEARVDGSSRCISSRMTNASFSRSSRRAISIREMGSTGGHSPRNSLGSVWWKLMSSWPGQYSTRRLWSRHARYAM